MVRDLQLQTESRGYKVDLSQGVGANSVVLLKQKYA